jgi:CBS domain containing-hemolysin-like protein
MGGDVALGVVAGLLAVVAALLAGVDAAVSSVSRVVAEQLCEEGRRGARRLRLVVGESARYLGPLLLVRVLCEVAAAAAVTVLFTHHVGEGFAAVGAAAVVVTVACFVLVEVGPRTLGSQQAVPFALRTSWLVVTVARVLGPLARLMVLVGNALTPGKGFRDGPFASEAELRDLVDEAERSGVVAAREADMLSGVFELRETLAREVMVPRPDIVFIERDKSVRQALTLALRSGFSRLPVVGESTDDVIGVVFLKDLVRKALDERDGGRTTPVGEVARPATYVPDSIAADQLLRDMQAQRTHLVVVVDEYGGTAGIVTIEDILEEIVGEITDEYDKEQPPVEELEDGSLRVTARLLVEEIEDRCRVSLPHDEGVETVSGLMAEALGRVPIPGAQVEIGGLRFTAESAAGRRNRVGTVRIERLQGTAVGATA